MGTVAGCLRNTRAVEKHLHSDSQSCYCRLQAGCLQPCLSSQSRLTWTHDCLCWQCIPQLCCTLASMLAFNSSQTGIPQQNKHSARFDYGACTMARRGSDIPLAAMCDRSLDMYTFTLHFQLAMTCKLRGGTEQSHNRGGQIGTLLDQPSGCFSDKSGTWEHRC